MDNHFSCDNISTKVEFEKYLKFTIKSYIQSKVLGNDKKSKEIKQKYKRGEQHICPDCGNHCKYLQNAHIGFTQEKMCKSIIDNMKKEDTIQHLLLEVERYLKYHTNCVEIAVVCNKCNSKYESEEGVFYFDNALKYVLDYDSEDNDEDEDLDKDSEINSDNKIKIDIHKKNKKEFTDNIKKISYNESYKELFKKLSMDILNHIGSTKKPLSEKQRKKYIDNLNILFYVIDNENLSKIYKFYNENKYQEIIDILKKLDFENYPIMNEYKYIKKLIKTSSEKINDVFLYPRPFNKCIIKLLEYYIKIGYQSTPSDSASGSASGSDSPES
jgi:hypothetical protein